MSGTTIPVYKTGTNFQNEQFIYRTADEAFIPLDTKNKDYQQYLLWTAIAGNVAGSYP